MLLKSFILNEIPTNWSFQPPLDFILLISLPPSPKISTPFPKIWRLVTQTPLLLASGTVRSAISRLAQREGVCEEPLRRGTMPGPRQQKVVPPNPLRRQPQRIPRRPLQLLPTLLPRQMNQNGYLTTHTIDTGASTLPQISACGRSSHPLTIPYFAPRPCVKLGPMVV